MKKTKKAASLVLAALLLVPGAAFAKSFPDVQTNAVWAKASIEKLADRGIINGYNDGNYYPGKYVSFEETASLLKGLLNPTQDEIRKAKSQYDDIVRKYGVSTWAIEPISYMLYKEIMNENDLKKAEASNYFKTREDRAYPERNAITIYYAKALGLSANGDQNLLKHTDKSDIPSATRGYLASLVKADIFAATGSNGKFEGRRPIRRSEMAFITDKSYEYAKGKTKVESEVTTNGRVMTDVSEGATTILVKLDSRSNAAIFTVNEKTKVECKGYTAKLQDLYKDLQVKVTYKTEDTGSDNLGTATKIEIIDSNYQGSKIVGYARNVNASYGRITIDYRKNYSNSDEVATSSYLSSYDTQEYVLARDVKIYRVGDVYNNNLVNVQNGDRIEYKLNSAKEITEAYVYPRNAKITGEVVETSSNSGISGYANYVVLMQNGTKFKFYIPDSMKDKPVYSSFAVSRTYSTLSKGDKPTFDTNYKVIVGENGYGNYDRRGRVTNYSDYGKIYVENYEYQIPVDRDGYITCPVYDKNNAQINGYVKLSSILGYNVSLSVRNNGSSNAPSVYSLKIEDYYGGSGIQSGRYSRSNVRAEGTITIDSNYMDNYGRRLYKVSLTTLIDSLNGNILNNYLNYEGYVKLTDYDYNRWTNIGNRVSIPGSTDSSGNFLPDSIYDISRYRNW